MGMKIQNTDYPKGLANPFSVSGAVQDKLEDKSSAHLVWFVGQLIEVLNDKAVLTDNEVMGLLGTDYEQVKAK